MTSDAKIGLLLGLVFIFIIAFVINGLPGLHHKDDSNKLTSNMVGLQNSQSGLGANERRVIEPAPSEAPPAAFAQQAESPAGEQDARFTMALPQNAPAATDSVPADSTPVAVVSSQTPSARTVAPSAKPDSAKPDTPKFYVVQEGDTLSSIAKKVYGEQEGNRLVNIKAIFEANRKTLASENELYVGQNLAVPPLVSSGSPASAGVLSGPAFTKVDSIGKRNLPSAADKPAPQVKIDSSRSGRTYVVKEGDSLWRIASEQLGDGNRYKEIVKLNGDILSSEDDIQVDMKLRLPAK